jgi:hypothetical protein
MADEEPAQPLRVISSHVVKGEGIRAVLEMLVRDSSQFEGLLAIAVVPTEDPERNDCVVYSTNFNYLEKLGLLAEAKDTISNSS